MPPAATRCDHFPRVQLSSDSLKGYPTRLSLGQSQRLPRHAVASYLVSKPVFRKTGIFDDDTRDLGNLQARKLDNLSLETVWQ